MKVSPTLRKDIYVLIAIQVIFWFIRIVYILNTDHSYHGDATSKVNISFQQFDHFYHWPVHFWLPLPFDIIHLAGMITGEWVTTTRIVPSLLLSISICFGYFYLKEYFSKFISVSTCLVLSLSPPMVIISTAYLAEAYSTSFLFISLYFYQHSKNKVYHSFLFGLFVSSALLTRYEMFIFVFVFVIARLYNFKFQLKHLAAINLTVSPTIFYIFYMNYNFSGNVLHGFFAHTELMKILNLNFPPLSEDLYIFKYGLPLGSVSLITGGIGFSHRIKHNIVSKRDLSLEIFSFLYVIALLTNILSDNMVTDFRFTLILGVFFSIYTFYLFNEFNNRKIILSLTSILLFIELGFNIRYFKENIVFQFDQGFKDTAHFVKANVNKNLTLYVDRVQEYGTRMWHAEAWYPLADRKMNNYHPGNSVKCFVDNSPVMKDSFQYLLQEHVKCLSRFKPDILISFKDGFLDRLIKEEDPSFNSYRLLELYNSNGYKVIRLLKNEKN